MTVHLIQKNKETYSEPCQTSKMELYVKIVEGGRPLANFAKSFILDVWQGSEYASRVPFYCHSITMKFSLIFELSLT